MRRYSRSTEEVSVAKDRARDSTVDDETSLWKKYIVAALSLHAFCFES